MKVEHKWVRDVVITLLVMLALVVVVLVFALSQVNWNVFVLYQQFEDILKANHDHLVLIGPLIPIVTLLATGFGAMFGRWIGHLRHESRDEKYIAEINALKAVADANHRAFLYQQQVIDLLEEKYGVPAPSMNRVMDHWRSSETPPSVG